MSNRKTGYFKNILEGTETRLRITKGVTMEVLFELLLEGSLEINQAEFSGQEAAFQ